MAEFRSRVLSALDDIFKFTSARRSPDRVDLVQPVTLVQDLWPVEKSSAHLGPNGETRAYLSFTVDGTAGAGNYYNTGGVTPGNLNFGTSGSLNIRTQDYDAWLIAHGCYVDISTGAQLNMAIQLADCGQAFPLAAYSEFHAISAGGAQVGYGNAKGPLNTPALTLPVYVPWTSTIYAQFVAGAAATAHVYALFEFAPKNVGTVIPG